MPIFSCKYCEKRSENCHSTCEVYLKEKAEYDRRRRETKEKDFVDQYITNKKCEARYKQLRRYGKSHI